MAISVLAWIIFLLHFAYNVRTKGWLAGINQTAGFLIAIALGSTVVTSAVWDWAPRQITPRVATSAGWQLIQDASGGTLRLGDQAAAIAQNQGAAAGSGQYVVTVSGGSQPVTTTTTSGLPAVAAQPVVSGFNYDPLANVPVTVVTAVLQLKHWDAPTWDVATVDPATLPNKQGTACGKWTDPASQRWLVACPASNGIIFPADQTDWRAAGISFPEPTPAPTAPPALTVEELNKKVGECWAGWAQDVNLRYVTDRLGTTAIPYGTNWTLRGPGGFLDWGTTFVTAPSEIWYLSSEELGILDYQINGVLGRSFPGANDSGTMSYSGTGGMCAVR